MSEAVQRVKSEPELNADVIPRRQIRSPRAPLAYAQEHMWALYQIDPSSSAFNLSIAVRLEGKLDVTALKRALATVVRRQEVLRTTFDVTADGRPFQSVHPPPSYWPLPLNDLSSRPDPLCEMRRLVATEAARPFNLQTGPTFRTALICLGTSEHVLLLSLHHIIADGWSIGILLREITVLYAAFVAGAPVPLANLPVQYADFAVWQRQKPALDWPTDFPRRALQSFSSERERFSLSEELSRQLNELGQHQNATVFMTLLAAFQLLLHMHSGQEDILIETNIANRNQGSTENLIGLFVNNVVLGTNFSGNPTFRELLARARDVTLGADAHRDVPFALVFQSDPLPALEVDGLKLSLLDSKTETSNSDLVLYITETGRQLSGYLHYNTDSFTARTIRDLLDRFQRILDAIVTDPECYVDSI